MIEIEEAAGDEKLITPSERWKGAIIILSVVVPVLVAVLIYLPNTARVGDLDVRFLPHLNGVLNSATSLCLIASLTFILRGQIEAHKTANIIAFFLSVLFLGSYVVYHYAAPPTVYGDINGNGIVDASEGELVSSTRGLYVALLLSHIFLAAIVLPFVLFAFYYALSGQYDRHKKIAKYTWPMWFYVAVTGVVVYLMIRPFYHA